MILFAISSCGQKGPLVLPEKKFDVLTNKENKNKIQEKEQKF